MLAAGHAAAVAAAVAADDELWQCLRARVLTHTVLVGEATYCEAPGRRFEEPH